MRPWAGTAFGQRLGAGVRAGSGVGETTDTDTIRGMVFERPAPDLTKLIAAWEEWERGEEAPGRVLANLKTAGLADVLAALSDSGWTPPASS